MDYGWEKILSKQNKRLLIVNRGFVVFESCWDHVCKQTSTWWLFVPFIWNFYSPILLLQIFILFFPILYSLNLSLPLSFPTQNRKHLHCLIYLYICFSLNGFCFSTSWPITMIEDINYQITLFMNYINNHRCFKNRIVQSINRETTLCTIWLFEWFDQSFTSIWGI